MSSKARPRGSKAKQKLPEILAFTKLLKNLKKNSSRGKNKELIEKLLDLIAKTDLFEKGFMYLLLYHRRG